MNFLCDHFFSFQEDASSSSTYGRDVDVMPAWQQEADILSSCDVTKPPSVSPAGILGKTADSRCGETDLKDEAGTQLVPSKEALRTLGDVSEQDRSHRKGFFVVKDGTI